MYIIINKILTISVGLFSFLYGFLVIYRICKKRYGKDSIILVGKIIAFRVGDGLKKTYIPIIEVTYNDVTNRYMAIDNLSFKEKYSLHSNVELYYNKSLRNNPILIKKDYGSLFYAIIILILGAILTLAVIIDTLQGGDAYARLRPWN